MHPMIPLLDIPTREVAAEEALRIVTEAIANAAKATIGSKHKPIYPTTTTRKRPTRTPPTQVQGTYIPQTPNGYKPYAPILAKCTKKSESKPTKPEWQKY